MSARKRSAKVSAPLLAAAAVAVLSGCRQTEMKRCVDERNQVVADSLCQTPQQSVAGPGLQPHHYRFYYGGTGSYTPGSAASGGNDAPSAGHTYASGTERGGFGSSHGGDDGGSGGGE